MHRSLLVRMRWLMVWLVVIARLASPAAVFANPYFFIAGDSSPIQDTDEWWSVYLFTDGQPVTAAQAVVTFDPAIFTKITYSTVSSRCNFWAPADPALAFGSTVTPYYYGNDSLVLSCGFSNPGYTSSGAEGALIARFQLTPDTPATSSFQFSEVMFRYIGSTIVPSESPTYDVTVYISTEAALAALATPTPTASPAANADTIILKDTDLNFVEISTLASGSSSRTTTTTTGSTELTATEEDDSIPAPPELEPRAKATPWILGKKGSGSAAPGESGEVLSVQSLRELLIPGKSSADRTVVLVNLISTLTFLALLGIVIWRLVTTSRMNRLKYRHLADILTSELSVLETKLANVNGGETMESVRSELDSALQQFTGGKIPQRPK